MKVRSGLWLLLYGALFATVTASFLHSYPIPDLHSKLFGLGSAVFLLLSLHWMGKLIIGWGNSETSQSFRKGSFEPLFESIAAIGLGFGVLGLIVLTTGWALQLSLARSLSVVSFLFGGIVLLQLIRIRRFPILIHTYHKFTVYQVILLCLAGVGMAASFLGCFSPITYYDSLVYHLALPALYNMWDSIQPVPFNLYSAFPAQAEMVFLYILNQLPEPEIAINLTCWAITLLLSLAAADWVSEWGGARPAIFLIFFWWTMPAVLFLSTGAYVDVLLAFYFFLSLRCLHKSVSKNWDNTWLVLSGLFSGFAFSTKYTGAICPLLIFGFILWFIFIRREISRSKLFIFGLSSFVPAVFWLVKNAVMFKNPVFPFFYSALGGNVGWTRETAHGYFSMLSEYGAQSQIFFEMISAPWKIATSATAFGGGFDVLGDFGWPLFIFAAPLAVFFAPKNKAIPILSLYFMAHFCLWFTTKPVLRFLVAALPVAAMLSAYSLSQLTQSKSHWIRITAALLITPWIISNFFIYATGCDVLKPFSVALGYEDRQSFLRKRLPFYSFYEALNQNLTSSQKILMLGEQRTYHLKINYISANIFAPSPLSKVANFAESSTEISDFMAQEGITHILISESEVSRLGGLQNFGFSERGIENLLRFLDEKCDQVAKNQQILLYRRLS